MKRGTLALIVGLSACLCIVAGSVAVLRASSDCVPNTEVCRDAQPWDVDWWTHRCWDPCPGTPAS